MRTKSCLLLQLVILLAIPGEATELKPEANRTFETYVAGLESRLQRQHQSPSGFIQFATPRSEAMAQLQRGTFIIDDLGRDFPETPGAMMHHWRATAFVPGAISSDFLGLMQDCNRMAAHYKPKMVWARLISHDGNVFRVAMRLREHRVITVTTDSEYDVHYGALDSAHGFSISRSTRVTEIANAGTKDEHAVDPASAHGFLWRINTYWSYEETNDGLLIQCEAVSITRDIPAGLGWIVKPFVASVPNESLEFTLKSTRDALEAQTANRRGAARGSR